MLTFTPLTVSQIRRETSESVSISLKVPPAHRDTFRYSAGQFLTFRAMINGEEVRRSYSLCESPSAYLSTGELRIAVKEVAGGRFSTFLNRALTQGASLDVLPPDGRFTTRLDANHCLHYVGFAGGSGITPLLSLATSILEAEPNSRFTLLYGNRTVGSIMFVEVLEDLKNRYWGRLVLYHVLSDEPQEVDLMHGLLDRNKCDSFLAQLIPAESIHKAFVCGPDPMMNAAEAALLAAGVARERILIERFGVPNASPPPLAAPVTLNDSSAVRLSIIADGKTRKIPLSSHQSVLDAGLAAGLALPYACKAGVCCTCKAKVLEGSVTMERNFTLTDEEQAQGFVLTCQGRCTSEKVVISYDER